MNTLMNYKKTPFLIEEQGLKNKGMWITFVWGSKEQIQVKDKWIEIGKVRELYPHLLNN